jgi:hypothetical protein
VEENVLLKAKQKRQLDFLVMTEGNFSEESLFSSQSLKDVLGVADTTTTATITTNASSQNAPVDSRRDIEAAMNAVEDDDDVSAMRTARAEAALEEAEFDENAPVTSSNADDDDDDIAARKKSTDATSVSTSATSASATSATTTTVVDSALEDKDVEAEFQSWQATVGKDFKALENALKPIERYGLRFHTDVEPYYSLFFINESQKLQSMSTTAEEQQVSSSERDDDLLFSCYILCCVHWRFG